MSPNVGPSSGGTSVTLIGSDFSGATSVTFGGAPANTFTVVNDSTLIATAPANVLGSVDVVVTNSGGSATLTNGFTYVP